MARRVAFASAQLVEDMPEHICDSSGVAYRIGDPVEYSSETRGGWVPAMVVRLRLGTIDLSVGRGSGVAPELYQDVSLLKVRRRSHKQAQLPLSPVPRRRGDDTLRRCTTNGGTTYQAGHQVEYSSESRGSWVPATVESVTRDGLVQLSFPDSPKAEVSPRKLRHDTSSVAARSQRERQLRAEAEREQQRRGRAERELAQLRKDERRLDAERAEIEVQAAALQARLQHPGGGSRGGETRQARTPPRNATRVAVTPPRTAATSAVRARNRWQRGDACEVYSASGGGWREGRITSAFRYSVTGSLHINVSYKASGDIREKMLPHDSSDVRPRRVVVRGDGGGVGRGRAAGGR